MMNWSDIPRHPGRAVLRQFAGLWIIFFASLACYRGLARGETALAVTLAVLAFTVGPIGLVAPAAIRPIFVGWMMAIFPVAWVVARLVLAFLFYGVFTPLAWAFRLLGRDALQLHRRPAQTTYWIEKPAITGVHRYFRQF